MGSNTFRRQTAIAVFDTASTDSSGANNTAIGAHGLFTRIPNGAIITNAYYKVDTTFTSSTDAATLAIKVQGANDLKAAIAISDASNVYDAGFHGCLPGSYALDGNASTAIEQAAAKAASYIQCTAVRELTVTVAVEVLTAGKLTIWVEFDLNT